MILELAVPRLHTTWIATKVETIPVRSEGIAPPGGKGKKITRDGLTATLQESMKSWGKRGVRTIWWSSL
jgi:hypothetical protein